MIDQCWQDMKKHVPCGLTTQSPWLLVYARSWQWRYINMSKNMLTVTAKAVRKALSWNCTKNEWQAWENRPKGAIASHVFFKQILIKISISPARNNGKKNNTVELRWKKHKNHASHVPKPQREPLLDHTGIRWKSIPPRAVSGLAGCICIYIYIYILVEISLTKR